MLRATTVSLDAPSRLRGRLKETVTTSAGRQQDEDIEQNKLT
jgi:hypothetical protein